VRGEEARRVLARAAVKAGGIPALAAELDMSERVLRHYIEGTEPVPDNLVLKVVDIILKDAPEPPN
jgi:hypothetical protein